MQDWFTSLLGQTYSVQFSHSFVSDCLWPHESQHSRPPCPSPTPGAHSNSGPSSWWCHPAISSSVVPFSSCPQSLPASVFSNESTHATIIALIPQDKENHVIHVKLVMLHQVYICSNHSSGPKKCPIHGCMDWMDTLWTRLYQVFIYCLVPIISLINEEAMLMLWFPQITSQTLCPEVFIMFGNSHFPA